jgi:hypothetical protein
MSEPLPVIDGLTMPADLRALLRPDELMEDFAGVSHALPRFFYRVENWDLAKATRLTPYFTLSELMAVDCREADLLLRNFPHYVPCTISILARYLDEFRQRVGAPVSVSVNGGYRSPGHRFSKAATPHLWGAAANIYRVGDTFLDSQRTIEKYAEIARELGQEVFTKPYGSGPGATDDHLHLDLGYLRWKPRELSDAPRPQSLS